MHYETVEVYHDLTGEVMVGLRSTDGTIIKMPVPHAEKLFGRQVRVGEHVELVVKF